MWPQNWSQKYSQNRSHVVLNMPLGKSRCISIRKDFFAFCWTTGRLFYNRNLKWLLTYLLRREKITKADFNSQIWLEGCLIGVSLYVKSCTVTTVQMNDTNCSMQFFNISNLISTLWFFDGWIFFWKFRHGRSWIIR